jgi:hypothetical protein
MQDKAIHAAIFAITFSTVYLLVSFLPFLFFFLLIPIGMPRWTGLSKERPERQFVPPALIGAGSGAIMALVFRYMI